MLQNLKNRNSIAALVILCLTSLTNILINIISNELTDYLKPLGVAVFIISLFLVIGFMILQGKRPDSSAESAEATTAGSQTPATGANTQDNLPTASRLTFEETDVNPTRPQSLPWARPYGVDLDIPLLSDGIDLSQNQEERPNRLPKVADREKVTALPSLAPEPHIYLSQRLPDRPKMLSWSPDGVFLACTFYGRPPRLIGIHDHSVIEVPALKSGEVVRALCWSPDGRTLALGMSSAIYFWDSMTRSECAPPLSTTVPVDGLDWSPGDRNQLAIGAGNQIQVYTLPDRVSPQTLSIQNLKWSNMNLMRWSPDGSLLVAATNGPLICWHMHDRSMTQHSLPSRHAICSLAWVPASLLLAVAFYDRQIGMLVWDAEKRQPLQTWNDLPVLPFMLSVSSQQCVGIASRENDLLFGGLNDPSPTAKYAGRRLAAWSPTDLKLATLHPQDQTILVILSQ